MIKLKLSKKKINKLKKTKLLRKRNLRKSLRGGGGGRGGSKKYTQFVGEPEVNQSQKNMKGRKNQIPNPNQYVNVGQPTEMSQTNPFFKDIHKYDTSVIFDPTTYGNENTDNWTNPFYTDFSTAVQKPSQKNMINVSHANSERYLQFYPLQKKNHNENVNRFKAKFGNQGYGHVPAPAIPPRKK